MPPHAQRIVINKSTGRWVYKVVTPTYPNGFLVNTTEPTAIYNPNAPSIPHAQQTYDPVKPSWPQQPYSPIEQQQQQQPPWSPSLTAYCEEPQPQPQPQPYPQAASQAPASPVAADQYPVLGQVPPEEQQEEGYLATDNISNTLHDAGSAATTRPKRRKARGLVGDDATTEILLLRDPRESGRVKVTINDTGRRITINTRGGGGGGDDGGTRRTTGRPPGRSREGGYRSRHDGYECGGLGEHGARCNEADGHMFR